MLVVLGYQPIVSVARIQIGRFSARFFVEPIEPVSVKAIPDEWRVRRWLWELPRTASSTAKLALGRISSLKVTTIAALVAIDPPFSGKIVFALCTDEKVASR